ncbi:unnamed protein product [Amoebophrya sp. A25]|nr:unnamed protein product [Amoebophrya sp. A25]|eukprot:GSA25T00018212001.1
MPFSHQVAQWSLVGTSLVSTSVVAFSGRRRRNGVTLHGRSEVGLSKRDQVLDSSSSQAVSSSQVLQDNGSSQVVDNGRSNNDVAASRQRMLDERPDHEGNVLAQSPSRILASFSSSSTAHQETNNVGSTSSPSLALLRTAQYPDPYVTDPDSVPQGIGNLPIIPKTAKQLYKWERVPGENADMCGSVFNLTEHWNLTNETDVTWICDKFANDAYNQSIGSFTGGFLHYKLAPPFMPISVMNATPPPLPSFAHLYVACKGEIPLHLEQSCAHAGPCAECMVAECAQENIVNQTRIDCNTDMVSFNRLQKSVELLGPRATHFEAHKSAFNVVTTTTTTTSTVARAMSRR